MNKGVLGGLETRLIMVLVVAGLILAVIAGAFQAYRAYELATGYVTHGRSYVSDEIYYVDVARRYLVEIFHVDINYYDMSGKTRDDYFNLEHPPLGKYIIALSMVVCGDRPLCWRLPGIVEAGLIPVLLYLAFLRFGDKHRFSTRYIVAGVIAAIAAGSDRIIYRDASVALLDIHLAFFTALTVFFLARDRLIAASISSALAFMVKMSGLAAIGGVLFYVFIRGVSQRKYLDMVKHWISVIFIVIAVSLVLYLPLINYFGPSEIVKETIAALRWHTSSRPEGPPTSTPIGWIFNSNPFFFSFSLVNAAAVTTTIIELFGVIAAGISVIVALISAIWKKRLVNVPGGYTLLLVFAMYGVIWLLGNHTFYSFYAVQLAPLSAMALAEFFLLASRFMGGEFG
ncbi:MAG: glycosyltransferase family 39 protein [Desulfurococcales archaeon]|nr:glycosyltransferase family 39 protein [Desulfurococcales archaeon]